MYYLFVCCVNCIAVFISITHVSFAIVNTAVDTKPVVAIAINTDGFVIKL